MSLQVHIVVPELLLGEERVDEACKGLHLPVLRKVLARSQSETLPVTTLENWLCDAFGVTGLAIAPVTLRGDGIEPGAAYWLRADPVHLHIRHDQMMVQPLGTVGQEDATQFCESLNRHFASEGLQFMAPNPQRWYLQLQCEPMITTHSLYEAAGGDVRDYQPEGAEALRWDGLLNEIQMMLFQHPANHAREERGELPVNSLWLWGGGYAPEKLNRPCSRMFTDSHLGTAFATVAGVEHADLPGTAAQYFPDHESRTLIIWDGLRLALQRGDLDGWCKSLRNFERECVAPLFQALRRGMLEKITLDVLQKNTSRRFILTRLASWKFWLRGRA